MGSKANIMLYKPAYISWNRWYLEKWDIANALGRPNSNGNSAGSVGKWRDSCRSAVYNSQIDRQSTGYIQRLRCR